MIYCTLLGGYIQWLYNDIVLHCIGRLKVASNQNRKPADQLRRHSSHSEVNKYINLGYSQDQGYS